MKRKNLVLALGLVAATSFLTSLPAIASNSLPLTETTTSPSQVVADTIYADVKGSTDTVMPNTIAKTDFDFVTGAKNPTVLIATTSADPDRKTISAMPGMINDDSSMTLKTALVNGSAQGDGGFDYATTTLAASSGSSTAAPAIGYSVTDLARLTKPDRPAMTCATA